MEVKASMGEWAWNRVDCVAATFMALSVVFHYLPRLSLTDWNHLCCGEHGIGVLTVAICWPSHNYNSGTFKDELSKELKHTGAGILSMVTTCVLHFASSLFLPTGRALVMHPHTHPQHDALTTGQRWSQHKSQPVLPHTCTNALA